MFENTKLGAGILVGVITAAVLFGWSGWGKESPALRGDPNGEAVARPQVVDASRSRPNERGEETPVLAEGRGSRPEATRPDESGRTRPREVRVGRKPLKSPPGC